MIRKRFIESNLTFFVVLILSGCSASDVTVKQLQSLSNDELAGPADSPIFQSGHAEPSAEKKNAVTDNLKIVRTANLKIRVRDLESSIDVIEESIARHSAFTSNFNSTNQQGNFPRASWQIRVPADKFESLISEIRMSGTVNETKIVTDDRTAEQVDLTARLRNLQLSERRVSKFMEESVNNVDELIKTEKELTRVRESIERIQALLDSLESRVAYSTVELTLHTETIQNVQHATTAEEQLTETLKRSWQNFARVMLSLTKFVILGAPWVVTGLVLLGVVQLIRRWFQRRLRFAKSIDA